MKPDLDITAEQKRLLLSLLDTYLPDTRTWVYGSRVKGTSRPASDLDILLFTTPAQKPAVHALQEALEESDLPFRVDLFIRDELPASFRAQIETDHIELKSAGGLA